MASPEEVTFGLLPMEWLYVATKRRADEDCSP
jgi:hypothetical protein